MPVTNYLWDEDNIVLETDEADATLAEYTYEPEQYGNLISERRGGETYQHHYDVLGSARLLTDETGQITDTFAYDAWGNELTRTGETETPFRWVGNVGYYFDAETGLIWVRIRPLRPTTARWTARDGMWPTSGMNSFVYADNNPGIMVDPSGLYSLITAVEEYCRRACPSQRPKYGYFCFRNCKETELSSLRRNFEIWYHLEKENTQWLKNLPQCPCELRKRICKHYIAVHDYGAVAVVEVKWVHDDENFGPPKELVIPHYHPGATVEIRSRTPNEFGAGQQCTYDSNGKLIEGGLGAGSADRKAPISIAHVREDVTTWEAAEQLCKTDREEKKKSPERCEFFKMYLEVRPIPEAKGCKGKQAAHHVVGARGGRARPISR